MAKYITKVALVSGGIDSVFGSYIYGETEWWVFFYNDNDKEKEAVEFFSDEFKRKLITLPFPYSLKDMGYIPFRNLLFLTMAYIEVRPRVVEFYGWNYDVMYDQRLDFVIDFMKIAIGYGIDLEILTPIAHTDKRKLVELAMRRFGDKIDDYFRKLAICPNSDFLCKNCKFCFHFSYTIIDTPYFERYFSKGDFKDFDFTKYLEDERYRRYPVWKYMKKSIDFFKKRS